MRNHSLWIMLVTASLVLPAIVLSDVERDRTGAVRTDASGVTRDQRELIEFKATLAALDDALLRNHLENYYTLNTRLKSMMERELKQSRARVKDAERDRRLLHTERMKASVGGSGTGFLDLHNDRATVQDEHQDIAGAKKRRDDMHKLIRRFEVVQENVREQDQRAYARNAALLDKFFELMRAEHTAALNLSKAE